jgi:putative membrane protein
VKIVKYSFMCLALAGLMALPGYARSWSQSSQNQSSNTGKASGWSAKKTGEMGKMSPQEFISKAAQDDMAEVRVAQLAQQKSSNPQVKQLAEKLMSDHEKNDQAVKQLAQKENVQLPTSLNAEHQAMVDRLQKLNGAQFDRAFLHMQVRDHEKDIRQFRQEAANSQNPDIKQYAQQTLPKLEEHLHMAETTLRSENGSAQNKTQTTASSKGPGY